LEWPARQRFEVVSAQKIEGRWFLKQMRIEEIQPGTGKVQSRTYLEIQEVDGRRGLRLARFSRIE